MIEFKNITFDDREKLLYYLNFRCNKNLCDYNFVNLFIWSEIYEAQWALSDETLIIYNGKDDMSIMPSGCNINADRILFISDELIKIGKSGNFALVEQNFIDKNRPALEEKFEFKEDPAFADYIYSVDKLINLKGKKLQKKKNLISQFVRGYPEYKTLKLEKGYFDECFNLAEKWCISKNCEKVGFSHEKSALGKALNNYDALELEGLTVFIENQMIAFSIFSKMNDEMYDVHFEKFSNDIKGAGQIINFETVKYLSGKCKFVNREQDLGIEGLRQAKQSYDPELVLLTYRLTRKNNE